MYKINNICNSLIVVLLCENLQNHNCILERFGSYGLGHSNSVELVLKSVCEGSLLHFLCHVLL